MEVADEYTETELIVEDVGQDTSSGDQEFLQEGQEPQMTISVKDVRANLPIKTIPKSIVEPTYQSINELREALYENLAAIPEMLGGGCNRHVGLILYVHVYDNLLCTPCIIPSEPVP